MELTIGDLVYSTRPLANKWDGVPFQVMGVVVGRTAHGLTQVDFGPHGFAGAYDGEVKRLDLAPAVRGDLRGWKLTDVVQLLADGYAVLYEMVAAASDADLVPGKLYTKSNARN